LTGAWRDATPSVRRLAIFENQTTTRNYTFKPPVENRNQEAT